MKRKVFAAIVVGALLIGSLTVYAATTGAQSDPLEALRAKVAEARVGMIKAQANVGLITEEQAERMIAQLEAAQVKSQPLTDEQQQELADAYAAQVEAYKAYINAQRDAGLISSDQAEAQIKQIEAEAAYQEKLGFENYGDTYGRGGRWQGRGRGRVGYGRMMGGAGAPCEDWGGMHGFYGGAAFPMGYSR